jgi:hypothetical protein
MDEASVIEAVDRRTGVVNWRWAINADRAPGERFVHATTYLDPSDDTRSVFLGDARHRLTAYRFNGSSGLDRILGSH